MKKLLLLCFINILIVNNILAQDNNNNWADINAKWHYSYSLIHQYEYYACIESIADTIINDTACKVLIEKRPNLQNELVVFDTIYTFEESGKVYYFAKSKNHFCLLYDFNCNAGDFWVLNEFEPSEGFSNIVNVDSVSTKLINGAEKKVLYVSLENLAFSIGPEVIEGIGGTTYLLLCEENYTIGPLRCYDDDEIGLYHFEDTPDCTYISTSSEINENESINLMYDNTCLYIKCNDCFLSEIYVYNINGSLILKRQEVTSELIINTSIFHDGLYLLKMYNLKGEYILNRFVKTK